MLCWLLPCAYSARSAEVREGEVGMKKIRRIHLALERVLLASALVQLARDVIELLSTVINLGLVFVENLGHKVRAQAPR